MTDCCIKGITETVRQSDFYLWYFQIFFKNRQRGSVSTKEKLLLKMIFCISAAFFIFLVQNEKFERHEPTRSFHGESCAERRETKAKGIPFAVTCEVTAKAV